jgi:hypothetical protein
MNGHIASGDKDTASSEVRGGAAPKSLARHSLEVAAPLARNDELRSLVKLFRAGILVLKDSLKASHET